MKTALIDSDIILHRAAILTEDASVFDAIQLAKDMHIAWWEASRAEGYIPCISSSESFRKDIYPLYKDNRKDRPKPKHLGEVYIWARTRFSPVTYPKWEADDILGFLSTCPTAEETIIVTIDKDLDQVPGWHCNPDKETIYEVSADNADLYRWMQVLSGDTTDGYAGIPGVGIGKARKYLDEIAVGDREAVVKAIYLDKGFDDLYYQQMLKCATIITHSKELECELLSADSTEASSLLTILKLLVQSRQ
jgi:5'-3' exonuclease